MCRNTCQAPAPSTRAASSSSAGTWVRPACRVMATNGRAPQTTTIMITVNPWSGWSNQLCCWKLSAPSRVSSQFTTPNSKSNIHCQMEMAVRVGIAQAATSPAVTSTRMGRARLRSSRATSVPSTMVSPTATVANTSVLATTVQKNGSVRMSW